MSDQYTEKSRQDLRELQKRANVILSERQLPEVYIMSLLSIYHEYTSMLEDVQNEDVRREMKEDILKIRKTAEVAVVGGISYLEKMKSNLTSLFPEVVDVQKVAIPKTSRGRKKGTYSNRVKKERLEILKQCFLCDSVNTMEVISIISGLSGKLVSAEYARSLIVRMKHDDKYLERDGNRRYGTTAYKMTEKGREYLYENCPGLKSKDAGLHTMNKLPVHVKPEEKKPKELKIVNPEPHGIRQTETPKKKPVGFKIRRDSVSERAARSISIGRDVKETPEKKTIEEILSQGKNDRGPPVKVGEPVLGVYSGNLSEFLISNLPIKPSSSVLQYMVKEFKEPLKKILTSDPQRANLEMTLGTYNLFSKLPQNQWEELTELMEKIVNIESGDGIMSSFPTYSRFVGTCLNLRDVDKSNLCYFVRKLYDDAEEYLFEGPKSLEKFLDKGIKKYANSIPMGVHQ